MAVRASTGKGGRVDWGTCFLQPIKLRQAIGNASLIVGPNRGFKWSSAASVWEPLLGDSPSKYIASK